NGEEIQDEARRRARHHPEIGEVGVGVADQEVVDVVLARIDAGGERRPRGRRFRRMRRAERLDAAALRGELLQVRQLALVHPFLDETRIHAVEAEDDEFLFEFFRSAPAAARARGTETNPDYQPQQPFHRRCVGSKELEHLHMRVLGVDVGARRVGLAVSDATETLARPLTTLQVSGEADAVDRVAAAIARLAAEEDGLRAVVVGLPARLDGTPSDATARVRAFVDALRTRTTLPIATEDEPLSSRQAESGLASREKDWRKRKEKLDAAAAAIILQDYLDRIR